MAAFEALVALILARDFVAARRLLEELRQAGGDHSFEDVQQCLEGAAFAGMAGEHGMAGTLAQWAITADPRSGLAHYHRGLALLGQYRAANPGNPLREKLLPEAAIEFDEALRLGFEIAHVYLNQAYLAELREDYPAMAAAAKAALDLDADLPPFAWDLRARALAAVGKIAEAAEELTQAATRPERAGDPHLLRARIWAAMHGGRYADAERLLEKALQHAPEDAELRSQYREAIKARSWWYRPFLAKDLWFERQSPSRQRAWRLAGQIAGLLGFAMLAALWGMVYGLVRFPHRAPAIQLWFWTWGWCVMAAVLVVIVLVGMVLASRTVSDVFFRRLPARPFQEGEEENLAPLVILTVVVMVILLICAAMLRPWLMRAP